MTIKQYHLSIGGQVQGVGFRPFVYRLAIKHGLGGWVRNQGARVLIQVQGEHERLGRFCDELFTHAPTIAQPRLLEKREQEIVPTATPRRFDILASSDSGECDIHVPPDYFTCPECLRELYDANDRRHRYPFINCTQCGPRYTLITALPYDRQRTTMAAFAMCSHCRMEYSDPLNRRFHAEPIACPECGPRLRFEDGDEVTEENEQALQRCVHALQAGAIVAIKGIGGYHLCCDARNSKAIARLRERKPRPHKPLAVMYPLAGRNGLGRAREDVEIDRQSEALLQRPDRPIVLVPRRDNSQCSNALAPGLTELGIMLPYSPLHHLLLKQFDGPLVATSANISGEPVLTDADEVRQRLHKLTNIHLHHNRPIARPADDSVLRVVGGVPRPLRVGRGLSPLEMRLPCAVPAPMLACGGHMKNTVALAWEDRVVVSAHIGDLDAPRSQRVFQQVIEDLQRLYRVDARYLICDSHPGYASHRWAKQQGRPTVEIFHHHAHAAMLNGEFPGPERWLVFTWDGVGYGEDGTLWGGETLLGRPGTWQRVAHWRPFHLPGGEKAGRQPWRSAAALCWASQTPWADLPADAELLFQAWQKGLNAPVSTAVGRLFDAAAALLGLCREASFEGQGPMLLEALAQAGQAEPIELPVVETPGGVWMQDWADLLPMLLNRQRPTMDRAFCFHASLAMAMVRQAQRIQQQHGAFTVGLSGGVFQNRLLTELAMQQLEQAGFDVHMPQHIPVNDGGLSFGQIIEASARLTSDPTPE